MGIYTLSWSIYMKIIIPWAAFPTGLSSWWEESYTYHFWGVTSPGTGPVRSGLQCISRLTSSLSLLTNVFGKCNMKSKYLKPLSLRLGSKLNQLICHSTYLFHFWGSYSLFLPSLMNLLWLTLLFASSYRSRHIVPKIASGNKETNRSYMSLSTWLPEWQLAFPKCVMQERKQGKSHNVFII